MDFLVVIAALQLTIVIKTHVLMEVYVNLIQEHVDLHALVQLVIKAWDVNPRLIHVYQTHARIQAIVHDKLINIHLHAYVIQDSQVHYVTCK